MGRGTSTAEKEKRETRAVVLALCGKSINNPDLPLMNRDDFQSFVASGRLTLAQVNNLIALAPGAFCLHRSWGFGRIHSFDLVLGQVLIDFIQKPQHPMQLDYAADSLTALAADHILVSKAADLAGLKDKAAKNPAEVIRMFTASFGVTALADRLEATLCGDVIPQAEWKKWLGSAKRASKKDGLIVWPTRKGEPFQLLDKPQTAADLLRERLSKTILLTELLEIAEEALKKSGKATDLKNLAPQIIRSLDEQIASQRDKNPSVLVEAIWIRDDLIKLVDQQAAPTNIQSIVQQVHNLHKLVADLSSHRQRHLLPIIKQSFPDWEQRIKAMVNTSGGKLLTEIVDFLIAEGKLGELQELFERGILEHRVGAEAMLWLCKNREAPAYAQWLPALITGRLLGAILYQLEVAALESGGRRKNPLSELLLSDATLIADLARACDAEEARDLGKTVLLSPAIEELDKRSIMARLIKVSPSVQSLLVNSQHQQQSEALIVSWESLERRKNEYEEIVNKKIPENSREIAVARSYGDLRENHEFKAAKEMQTVLMRQKAELENMLARARGTDFYKPDTSAVNIGTRVTLQSATDDAPVTYTILGAWESDPEKGVISYQTAMAAALLGKKVGEKASLPNEDGERPVQILSIEAAFPENEPAEKSATLAQPVNA